MSLLYKGLVFDIETGPNLAYVWGKYQQDVIRFKDEWSLLSMSWKWLGEKKTFAVGLDKFTEEQLVLRAWQLLDESDFVIAHNGDRFDIRMLNAKFLEYGLTPPSPYNSVDTLKVVKKIARLNSNKLDDVGTLLKVGNKLKHEGFDLWLGCMRGDKRSWRTMLKYNKQDVVLLEKVYLKLLPWINNHPAVNVISQRPDACPKCGGQRLHQRGTRKHTRTGMYHRYQCQSCGGWCNDRRIQRAEVAFVN